MIVAHSILRWSGNAHWPAARERVARDPKVIFMAQY